MSIAALRDENEQLKALLAQTQAALSEHQGALAASEEARRRLEVILGELRREKFGAKSEKLRPDQYHLPLEDVEIAQGILDVAQERAEALIKGRSRSVPDQGSHRNRGCLPAHLPRVERIIEPASTLCPCGCVAMTKIGEDVSKRLDGSRRNGGCWSRAARNTSVATVRALSCRRTHRNTSCPAGCRPKRPLRT